MGRLSDHVGPSDRHGEIPAIDSDTFQSIASKAKARCLVSKLINVEIGFEATLVA
jgi:organic hydroperoxide reductase OsmC/OhrA